MVFRSESPDGRFIARSLGPTIACNFFEDHYPNLLKFLEEEKDFDKSRDYILLVVGEVDCRLHLVEQLIKQPHRPEEEVIHECVDRFFRCHLDLKDKGYRVIGWGNHSSSIDEGPWTIGPYPKRLFIARCFEERLRKNCRENNILFKSIFNSILTPDDLPEPKMYLDICHLNPVEVSNMINKEFEEELKIKS
jgi:hypothetical protein